MCKSLLLPTTQADWIRNLDMAPPKVANAKRGTVNGSAQNLVVFTIRAAPLPQTITDFLLSNMSILRRFHTEGHSQARKTSVNTEEAGEEFADEIARQATVKPEEFWSTLEKLCKEAGGEWADVADRIWAFGPHRVGPNILVDRMGGISTS